MFCGPIVYELSQWLYMYFPLTKKGEVEIGNFSLEIFGILFSKRFIEQLSTFHVKFRLLLGPPGLN